MSFQIGRVQWLTIGAALLAIAADVRARLRNFREPLRAQTHGRRRRQVRHTGLILLWLAIVAVTLFLMTDAAAGVWERVPALAFLQFPWRLLMAIAVAASALTALLLARVRMPRLQAIAGLVIVVAHVMLDVRAPEAAGLSPGPGSRSTGPAGAAPDPAQSAAYIESWLLSDRACGGCPRTRPAAGP